MSSEVANITDAVKRYILEEFLPGESPDALDENTPLISSAILDSIATLKLVAFLEERYDVQFAAHEINVDNLDTVSDITATLKEKVDGKG